MTYSKHPDRLRKEAKELREALKQPREGWPPAEEKRLLERAQWFGDLADPVVALEKALDLGESRIRSAKHHTQVALSGLDQALKTIEEPSKR